MPMPMPMLMPRPKRPSLRTSTSAACLASRAVWRRGATTIAVTSSRSVIAARNPYMTRGSWNVVSTLYGPCQPTRSAGSAPSTWS
jgi:hypothetical protein